MNRLLEKFRNEDESDLLRLYCEAWTQYRQGIEKLHA